MIPLRKCLSLAGPVWAEEPQRENYRFCRDYIDQSGIPQANYWKDSRSTWLKLWVNWNWLQPNYVANLEESWNQLNGSQNQAILTLDAEIKQANVDGIPVILSLYQEYPGFATGNTAHTPGPGGRPWQQKVPSDRDADSPYGWFLSWLFARYRYGVNPGPGPVVGGSMGNPSGAYITGLIPVNEPNFNMWPQDGSTPCCALAMVQTAAALSYFWSRQAPVQAVPTYVFGPATSDCDGTTTTQTDYLAFTNAFLDLAKDWRPNVYVGWAHHNYSDVEKDTPYPGRVGNVRNALYNKNWKGGTQNKYIWLTEGGCRLSKVGSNKTTQATRVRSAYNRMRNVHDVYMFTQYGMDDYLENNDGIGIDFNSHLRDPFNRQLQLPGNPRPVFWTWKSDAETPASTVP